MSSDDVRFIEELTAWAGPEGESRDARLALLAGTEVVSVNTLKQILRGRYVPGAKMRSGIRAQITLLNQEGSVSPEYAKASIR
jgi:hypothetical protein